MPERAKPGETRRVEGVEYRIRADGSTAYRVSWRHGGARDGQRQSRTFDRLNDARSFRAALVANNFEEPDGYAAEGGHLRVTPPAQPADDQLTVDGLAQRYFDHFAAARKSQRTRTVDEYRRDYRKWIAPTFGELPAAEVDPDDVQDWAYAIAEIRSPRTTTKVHNLLSAMYRWAIRSRALKGVPNPCEGTDLPTTRRRTPRGLNPEEWQALYEAAQQIDPDAADLMLFLVGTGWRWGEAIALTVADVDQHIGGRVYVRMTQVARTSGSGAVFLVQDEGKSQAAMRRTQLSPTVAEMVLRRCEGRAEGDFLFPSPQGKLMHYGNFRTDRWLPVLALATERGLRRAPTLHWLRHTHVFWLADTKLTSLPELQKRVGHESISTTIDVYGRQISDVSSAALQAFDGFLQVG